MSEVRVQCEFTDERSHKVNVDAEKVTLDQTVTVASGGVHSFPYLQTDRRKSIMLLVSFPQDTEKGFSTVNINGDSSSRTLTLTEGEAHVLPLDADEYSITVTNSSLTDGTARLVAL